MFKLISDSWRDFWFSPEKAVLQARAVLGFASTAIMNVLQGAGADLDFDKLSQWSWKQWAARFLLSAAVGAMGALKAGEKNAITDPPKAETLK